MNDHPRHPDPLTRVVDARREVGETDVDPVVATVLSGVFVIVIALPSLLQLTLDPTLLRAQSGGARAAVTAGPLSRVLDANRALLSRAEQMADVIGERSVLVDVVRPEVQQVMTGLLQAGTELVYTGNDQWLFFGTDVGSVTGPPFLAPSVLLRRSTSGDTLHGPPQPDPRVAILDLHRALRARGIDLVVMPTPTKPSVHPEQLGGLSASTPRNASFAPFTDELQAEGVLVFDPSPVLSELKSARDAPLYLATDTHWRPETMTVVAGRLAAFIEEHVQLPPGDVPYRSATLEVVNQGDTTRLLDLKSPATLFPSEAVRIRQISPADGTRWRSDPDATVLLLGDSFTNIYSLETMGWGESAGLAEQLSYELGRSVDRISQNDGGAHAPREQLATELSRGRDRLDGKRVVVYQFSERELSYGDWRRVDLNLRAEPNLSTFATPNDGQRVRVRGVIHAIGPIPTPGSVPYKDHIVGVHVSDLEMDPGSDPIAGTEAAVYLWAMQDDELTIVAQYQVGDTVALELEPWADVADVLEGINRGELSDTRVQLAEPWWGRPAEETP